MFADRPPTLIKLLAAALTVGGLFACTPDRGLRPYSSDGCSLFPDSSLIGSADWCSCCFEHDIAYWQGGTEADREAADRALQACVTAKTGNKALGRLMYEGVQAGGSPYFYNWYRWGYGWGFERKYQALSPAEKAQAQSLLDNYFANPPAAVCTDQAGGSR